MFLQFNDNTRDRGLFYQALTAVLEIAIDDELEFEDYYKNLSRMFGEEKILAAVGSVNGDVRFYGLTETGMQLEGIDRHQRLITSYQKLHAWRVANAKR
ncbi:hypothetical protein KSP9073_00827 [Kushneria phyllosphaerae]|uniref:YcaO cyclodehydratase C-terminal domain-containing protein n=1 Tax=Kushneria phyllosphaerae TaxID=2100822 RepID=A0A2R8CIW3_9GAMM|nr:hypothetical protein KSP9073_00827 [Kushneria phyllosphaerae]